MCCLLYVLSKDRGLARISRETNGVQRMMNRERGGSQVAAGIQDGVPTPPVVRGTLAEPQGISHNWISRLPSHMTPIQRVLAR